MKSMLFDDPNLLSNEEIRTELTEKGYDIELVKSIIDKFWIHDWGNSFIAIKEHFVVLQQFLAEENPKTFSRFDFYSYFYSKTIPSYEELSDALQKIAVVFELMHANQLEVRDFEEVLKELQVQEKISLRFLEENNLIEVSEKNDKKIAKWIHHTLTEYLAAVYIRKQEELIQSVNKFMCSSDTHLMTFIPSWLGTLRFLIEKDPTIFIDWLEAHLETNSDFLNDELSEEIVFDTPSSIPEEYKTKLFDLIYNSYQKKKWWIPVWAYHNLYRFIDSNLYQSLKDNADNDSYEYRGNTAAVIDGMLKNNHPLIKPAAEKKYWKEKLVKYANDENTNGVLQRHSLAALENFAGDSSIVAAVSINGKSNDSLVREAFINMCKAVSPNSPASIEYFIKGISEDTSHIYARNALYSISSSEGIKNFLKGIVENEQFIHQFLDKESIFNKKEKQADEPLILNIEKNLDAENAELIKKLIINAFIGSRNYSAGTSYFLQKLALLVKTIQPNYLTELIETIKELSPQQKSHLLINDFEGVLSVLLEVDELEKLRGIFSDELDPHAGYTLAEAIRLAPQNGNPDGAAVLKKGIDLGITADPNVLPKYVDFQKQQESKIYKQFQQYLTPSTERQYFPIVFNYYLENQEVIDKYIDETDEKDRLLKLAVDEYLEKFDPSNIQVHYKDQETKSGEYTISSFAPYFGNALEVIHVLNPALLKTPANRKKVIDYLPFMYLSDFRVFREILGDLTDDELQSVNTVMLDNGKDIRYLIPQTYIYLAETYSGLSSPKEVLLSLIEDPKISDNDREYALNILKKYITAADASIETLLKQLWQPETRNRISDLANELLITVFRNEDAINWRFDLLKSSAQPFHKQEGVHSVGELEYELDYMHFAKPVIELRDENYLDKVIDLLNFSLTINGQEEYSEYVNYLWRIAIAFVIRDNFLLSISALQGLREWAAQNNEATNINWFSKRLEQTTTEVNQNLERIKDIKHAIDQLT